MKPVSATAALILMMTASAPAYAYIDPASGTLLLQALIGGAAAAILVIRNFWGRIKTFFGGRSEKP